MAFFDSSISRFHIDDTTGASRDLSASITEIEGIPGIAIADRGHLAERRGTRVHRRGGFETRPYHRHAYRHLRRLPKRRGCSAWRALYRKPPVPGRVQLRPRGHVPRQREVLGHVLGRTLRGVFARGRASRLHRHPQSGRQHRKSRPYQLIPIRSDYAANSMAQRPPSVFPAKAGIQRVRSARIRRHYTKLV